MAVINTSDIELWWSHPNYTPPVSRVRGYSAAALAQLTAASPGQTFRMDASIATIDDINLPSLVGRQFSVKEHLGIGQKIKRRSYVDVADVKEASGTFIVNIGDSGGPDEFFNAVLTDPGLNNSGVVRPMSLIAVLSKIDGYSVPASPTAGAATAAGAVGDTSLPVDTFGTRGLLVGDRLQVNGTTTVYEVTAITTAFSGGAGTVTISPGLDATHADNDVINLLVVDPNYDTYADANLCDYIISELDFAPELEGELMGNFTLQSAGTGFEYVRAA